MTNDITIFILLALASGRVAYAITHDEIMRPLREWVWSRWAPEDETVRRYTPDGDVEIPARMIKRASDFEQLPTHPDGSIRIIDAWGDLFVVDYVGSTRTPTLLGKLAGCFYCTSFWTSAIALIAWLALGDDVIYPALPLALWSAANIVAVKGLS